MQRLTIKITGPQVTTMLRLVHFPILASRNVVLRPDLRSRDATVWVPSDGVTLRAVHVAFQAAVLLGESPAVLHTIQAKIDAALLEAEAA